ncbi:MAG: hypothetical protein VKK80_09010 [Prochlorothrix sp.]|nr:hypothetical protein [Prochlorothrix sp.]
MSQQDNFAGGFLLGAIFGGVLGGVLGVTLANRYGREWAEAELEDEILEDGADLGNLPSSRRRIFRDRGQGLGTEADADLARQGLEDKIAQLNEGIDNLRQQLEATHRSSNGSHLTEES